jgi:hypothetical protein
MTGAFNGSTEIDLPVNLTYDFEVAGAKYLYALGDGEIPLILLFSGMVFFRGETNGFNAEPVAWSSEASYRLPVAAWRETMDRYFPNAAWLRLHRDTFDAVQRFKAKRALPTWDDALTMLLKEAGEAE